MSGGTPPYTTFSVSGFSAGTTGLTAGDLTTNAAAGTVTLSGTPSAAGTASFTVNVTDTAGATFTAVHADGQSCTEHRPAVLAEATAGTATSQTITVSDGSKPYTTFNVAGFSAGATGLTAGDLTTDAAAGTVTLSGTPTAAGTASFTVDVIDTAGATLSQELHPDGQSGAGDPPAALAEATARHGDQPDDHGVGRHQALHHLQHLRVQCRDHRADGGDLTTNATAGTVVLSGTPRRRGRRASRSTSPIPPARP